MWGNFYDVIQKRECKKNILCKVSISNSLCSRTVKFTIFKVIFGHATEFKNFILQIHCPFMPLRKDNNGAKFIVSLNQNNSEGFIGAPQLFFSWKVYFLSFKKRPNINLHVKYSWKICNVKSGFIFLYAVEQFSSLFSR